MRSVETIKTFKKVDFDLKPKQISCGWAHSLLLTEDGRVFSSGDGKKGQLGFESTGISHFEEVKNIPGKVIQVACGVWSSFGVLENGQVYFWGQFRTLKQEICTTPTLLDFSENVRKISVGHKHILTLSYDGKISGHGCNKYGQIALEECKSIIIKNCFAGWNHSILWLNTNELVLIGKNDHNQLAHLDKSCHENVLKFVNEEILDLSVGSDHAMLLTSKRLLVWGWNEHGILGQGHINQIYGPPQELKFDMNEIERIKSIICGPVSCFIIKTNK